jgi:hypothetical protein
MLKRGDAAHAEAVSREQANAASKNRPTTFRRAIVNHLHALKKLRGHTDRHLRGQREPAGSAASHSTGGLTPTAQREYPYRSANNSG